MSRVAPARGNLRVGVFSYNASRDQPTLDGKPLKHRFGPGELKQGEVPEIFALAGTEADALIAELRNGWQLILPTEGGQTCRKGGLVAASIDPLTGELSSDALAMGMGGCGTALRWRYDGRGFTLTRAAEMNTCMGLEQAYWPVLWRTEAGAR